MTVAGNADRVVYIVQGSGARRGRRCCLQGRDQRTRQGRKQICVEVNRPGSEAFFYLPQWLDAGLIFDDHDAAIAAWRRAKDYASTRPVSIPEACILLCLAAVPL